MQTLWLRATIALLFIGAIAGCAQPQTPQEASRAFWQAVVDGDAEAVADHSTLADPSAHDGFDRDWSGTLPLLGRVVIEGDQATVATQLPTADDSQARPKEVITYVVERDGAWTVDYDRTRESVVATSPLQGLIDQVNRLGETLSERLSQSSEDIARQMQSLSQKLDALSAEASQRARQIVDEYGALLRQSLQELKQSIDEALENTPEAPEEQRDTLQTVSQELEQRSEELREPTLDALGRAYQTLADTQRRLARVTSDAFESYRQQWNTQLSAIQQRIADFFSRLEQEVPQDSETDRSAQA